MEFSRKRIALRTVTAVLFLGFLTVKQWRYIVLFHTSSHPNDWQAQGRTEIDEAYLIQGKNQSLEYKTTIRSENEELRHHRPGVVVVNEIIHRAFFGLGHRLHRSAASYHLARSLSSPGASRSPAGELDPVNTDHYNQQPTITHLRFHWESCLADGDQGNSSLHDEAGEKKEYNVFRFLFGEDLWELKDQPENSLMASTDSEGDSDKNVGVQNIRNMIVLRNDIPGYIAGQLYKDLKLPVKMKPKEAPSRNNKADALSSATVALTDKLYEYDTILDKVMHSDVHFYRRLVDNYRFERELQDFQVQHKWGQRPLVVGLHLRAGNGEDAHFVKSGRGASIEYNESTMITRLMMLINEVAAREILKAEHNEQDDALSPLLFVATDTAHLIPLVEKVAKLNAHNDADSMHGLEGLRSLNATATNTRTKTLPLQIITWPQSYLPKNAGVGFDALKGKGDRCLEGWKSAMSDILLLSKVDVLVAARRSTFTQSLPISLGFDRSRKYTEIARASDISSGISNDPESDRRRFSFCEVSESDTARITCFGSMQKWLFRGKDDESMTSKTYQEEDGKGTQASVDPEIWTLSIPATTSSASDQPEKREQVEHKVTVLLPDVVPPNEMKEARDFLRREGSHGRKEAVNEGKSREAIFRYGRSKIYKKYRAAHKTNDKTTSGWNLVLSHVGNKRIEK